VSDALPDAGPLALAQVDFLVVDLETTGLARAASTILEIGAVRVQGGCAVERFATLVDPGVPIPPAITALTGIDALLVRGAPPLAAAITRFAAWLARFPGAPFVAHNASFDEGFVSRALALHGLPGLARPVLCTRRLARRLLPDLRRHGLDRLAAHLGLQFGADASGRHRALGDAEVTAQALLQMLGAAQEHHGIRTLAELVALERRPPQPRRPAGSDTATGQPAPAATSTSARPGGRLRPPCVAST
jgi:DNA polymerase-3 subunit epsilon